MEDFKELYEQAIEATFSGKLHRMLYDNELTEKPLSKENRDAFRNLFQRYKDLRKLGDTEFVEDGLRDRMDASKNDSEMTIEQINAEYQMDVIAKAIAIAIMAKQDYENMAAPNLNKCVASNDSEKGDEGPTPFTKIMDTIHDTNANRPYICARCCSELWEATKYCPHCGRRNTNFKEEKE